MRVIVLYLLFNTLLIKNLVSDGSVYAWGEGSNGQLGLNSLEAWKHYPSRMESVRHHHIVG